MLKKILLGLLGLFLLAAVGVQFVDWNQYKQPILEKVKQSTGYDVQVSGALGFGIFPLPALSIEGVLVKNPNVRSLQPIVTLDKLYVRVNVFSLLFGKISVDSVKLVKPIIYFEVGPQGQTNLQTNANSQATSSSQPEGKSADLQVNRIVIADGKFTYVDVAKKEKHVIENLNVNASLGSLKGPIEGDVSLDYNGYSLDGSIDCGVIRDLFPDVLKLNVQLKHQSKDFGTFKVDGGKSGSRFQATVTSENVKIPVQIPFGEKIIDLQKGMTLKAQILAGNDEYKVSDLDAQFDGIHIQGRADYGAKALGANLLLTLGKSRIQIDASAGGADFANGSLHVRGSHIHDFLTWLKKADLQAYVGDSFFVKSQLSYTPKLVSLNGLSFQIGKYQGAGQVRYQQTGSAAPTLSCDIQMPQLDLALAAASTGVQQTSGGNAGRASASRSSERWSSEPLNLAIPKDIEVKARLRIDNLAYQKHKLTNVVLESHLKSGDLASSSFAAQGYGGKIVVKASMLGSSKQTTIDANVANLALHEVPELKKTALKKGSLSIATALKTKATSMKDLVSHLNGQVTLNVAHGVVEAFDVKSFIADLKQTKDISGLGKLKGHFERKKDLAFQHLKGDFQISAGVANTQNVDLLSADMLMQAKGTIDLPQWLIDLKAKVKFPELDQIPHLGVFVKGSIDAPAFGVDQGQLAKIIAQGLASQVLKQVQKNVGGQLGNILGKIIPGNKGKSQDPKPQNPEENPKGGNLVDDLLGSFMR